MHILKKALIGTLSIVMAMSVAACGNSGESGASAAKPGTQAGNTAQSAVPGDKVVTLRLAHNQQTDQGYGIGVSKLNELLKEKSKGSIELQIFDNGVLGNERDVMEGNMLGTTDISITSVGVVSNFEPLVGTLNLPFIFKDFKHVEGAIEKDVMKPAWDSLLKNKNLRVLGLYAQGFRYVASNKAPINAVEDFKGLKIRVPEAPLYVSTFKTLNANPTPIPWGEMYTSMQTHVVDAFENSPTVIYNAKLQEVIKYLSATNHIWDGGVVLINEDVFKKMSPDQQKILQECIVESAKYQRETLDASVGDTLKEMKAAGVIYNEISAENYEKIKSSVQSVYDDFFGKTKGAKELADSISSAK